MRLELTLQTKLTIDQIVDRKVLTMLQVWWKKCATVHSIS